MFIPGLAALLAGMTPASAPTNQDCLDCHADSTTRRKDGRPVTVDAKVFTTSVHGTEKVACVDCHSDLAEVSDFPHKVALAPVDCGGCHDAEAAAYKKSVHGKASAKCAQGDAPTCTSCHGVHDILRKTDSRSRTNHFKVSTTCERCHGNRELRQRNGVGGGDVATKFEDSIHGRALKEAGLVVAPTCSDCHGAHDIINPEDPDSRLYRTKVPATCGKCHVGIEEQYTSGVHGQALKKGSEAAPSCATCHSAHDIQRVGTGSWRLQVLRECGDCHRESMSTYRDTYHGQVTSLGFERIATCADCHGAHAIFPKSDPRSSISESHRLDTCKKCHPGATAGFANYDPHANAEDPDENPQVRVTTIAMRWLLAGTFGFFGLHTLLWLVRGAIEARRRKKDVHVD